MLRKITVESISILFIVLWIYAGISKLIDFEKFKFQLGRSPYIEHYALLVAYCLPVIEIVIATLLVFKRTKLLGLYASFFLILVFTGYIYAMLHYSYFIPCSCGGILAKMSWHVHFIFNIIFTVFAMTGILLSAFTTAEDKNFMSLQNNTSLQ